MTLGPKRIQLFLALVASAVALAGLAAPSAAVAGGAVYTMHREGLRVRLEVRGEEIISTDVWTRHRCTDGYEGGAALHLRGPGQEIPLNRSGAFNFRWHIGDGYWMRIHLTGRVHARTITGTYTAWERRGPSRPVCGTGRPGERTLRFTARR